MSFRTELDVTGRRVVCASGDARALPTITGLLAAGAAVVVVAAEVATTVRDLAERDLLSWIARDLQAGDLTGAALLVAEADDGSARDAAEQAGLAVVGLPGGAALAGAPQSDRPTGEDAEHRDSEPVRPGEVVLVGGGPGDPGLLTVAGLEAIRTAQVIVTDRLAPLASLVHARPDALVIDVSKIPRGEFTPQERINAILVEHALAGRDVVRLKGGDNFIFGRGGEEWEACAAAGITVRVIPGVSSAVAAPALAGIPLTHRTMTQGFAVVSAHLPPGHAGSTIDWTALARSGLTLVILMGVATLPAVTAHLQEAGLASTTPAATVADAGLPSQRAVRGSLEDIAAKTAEAGVKPPAVTVIGEVAGFSVRPD